MPKRKAVWSSWNYLGSRREREGAMPPDVTLTYWMNKLQPLATKNNYFVTLNPDRAIAQSEIAGSYAYRHPIFDTQALNAQKTLWSIQGRNRVWYAGSYFGYGFHEDGLEAGLAAAEDMTAALASDSRVSRPWAFDASKSRIAPRGATRNTMKVHA